MFLMSSFFLFISSLYTVYLFIQFDVVTEPILPIIRKLRRAPKHQGATLLSKMISLFLNVTSGYENMNDHLF